ncbi:putative sec1-like protein [Medicago truncatula]|uniref:Putative sec1-like protein n=1 Tax=Medicago truncatula TaxID=3880 RepID=A0A396IFB3_MEDTR|nr:putative sec1-like protein [Medicago truncatula]
MNHSALHVAPVIHEWTYDAMIHDLLDMDGNKYIHEVASKTGGSPEKKEVLLEEHDAVWLELRHSYIADVRLIQSLSAYISFVSNQISMLFYQLKFQASERLHDKFTNFVQKNKAAQIHQSGRYSLAPLAQLYTKLVSVL